MDTIVNIIKSLPRGAKRFAREVRREYHARMAASMTERVLKAEEQLHRMNADELAEYNEDVAYVRRRAEELLVRKYAR
jgi:ubiquinone biosynthesis protein UbiJ